MDIETLLREATQAHAEEAGPPLRRVDSLAAVARWRARRRRARQTLAGVATVVAVAAGIAVPQLMEPTGDRPLMLAGASYTLPAFPYTPGWVPDGVAEPSVQLWGEVSGLNDREIVVEHDATDEPDRVVIQMRILSSAGHGDDQADGLSREDVVVRGTPGVLTDDGGWLAVTWTDPAGRQVEVSASDRLVGRAGLLRYVEELVEAPLPVTPPVTLAAVPVDAVVSNVQPYHMGFDLPDGGWFSLWVHDPANMDRVRADLQSSSDDTLPPPVAVEVAGRPAELVDIGDGKLALIISFEPDLMLRITPWSHSEESLLAFAEGATLTPYARPAPAPSD